MWTVRMWTRHTGDSHCGLWGSEAEAFREAARQTRDFAGCGVVFEAVECPEDLLDVLALGDCLRGDETCRV